MSALRKIKRVGKKASKFQYTATYQSVVVECQKIETWQPNLICVSWSRRGRRLFTHRRPWQSSRENPTRGVVIWPEKEVMEVIVTLYKSPKDTSYETKEWEFNVIDVDAAGKRKILATTAINMVRYASTMPFDHDVQLQLKPVSRKIKRVILDITLSSILVKEGKATDEDMMSIASMMSVSNLSMIGNLEDDDDNNYGWHGGRSITPPQLQESILSTEELLKWTQEVTSGYRGVKVTNMTTSWRTGMGFLAIVHYYRPDLIDIEAVSPNAIKENNKLAFDLAQHLGVSCPLTPGAMISATVPDKLLVSSFLFNMHQYFTRAVPSAIAKDGAQSGSTTQSPASGDKPSSPFDISKIHKVFDDPNIYNNLSPVASPAHTGENRYSRHSSRRSSATEDQGPEGRTIPVSGGGYGVKTHSSSSSLVLSTNKDDMGQGGAAPGPEGGYTAQGGADPGREGSYAGQRGADPGQEGGHTGHERKLVPGELETALDKLVQSSASEGQVPSIRVSVESNGNPQIPDEVSLGEEFGRRGEKVEVKESTKEDRLLEYEAESGSSEPQTSSSVSLDDFRGEVTTTPSAAQPGSVAEQTTDTAVDSSQMQESGHLLVKEIEGESRGPAPEGLEKRGREPEGASREMDIGRRRSEEVLRSRVEEVSRRKSEGVGYHRKLPTTPAGSQEMNIKNEERRQKAKDLLRKHRISPASADFFTAPSTTKGKPLDPKQEKYREQVRQMLSELHTSSDSSHRPHRPSRDDDELTADLSTTSLPEIREAEEKCEDTVVQTGRTKDGEREDGHTTGKRSSLPTHEALSQSSSDSALRRRVGVVDRPQVVVVGSGDDLTPPLGGGGGDQSKRPRSATTHAMAARERLASEKSQTKQRLRTNTGPDDRDTPNQSRSHRKKPPVKKLEIKPVQTEPSAAAQRLLESKREKSHMLEVDGLEGGGEGERGGGWGKRQDKGEGGIGEIQNGNTDEVDQTGGNKMESPSPWDEHNEGLQKAILMTTNEYVRCELSRLQNRLQDMEKRAVEIESDVRHAMSTGNKEDEESMMQEWFSLLNGKNELIKKQIELNLVEKEEELEKKQFFINRELRPLMLIADDQKTPQQKSRADTLMQDHLTIIDERDKLERRKMSICSRSAPREDMLSPQSQTGAAVHERQGSKDCVIS